MSVDDKLRGDYSDITIVVDGHEFKCHKYLLARRSEYFDTMFTCPFDVSSQDKVEIKDVSLSAFRYFLLHANGDLFLNIIPRDDLMAICELAEYLIAGKLKRDVITFLTSEDDFQFEDNELIEWWKFASIRNYGDLVSYLWNRITERCFAIPPEDLTDLSFTDMVKLVRDCKLTRQREKPLFTRLLQWYRDNTDSVSDSRLYTELIKYMRLGLINDNYFIRNSLINIDMDETIIDNVMEPLERYRSAETFWERLKVERDHQGLYFTLRDGSFEVKGNARRINYMYYPDQIRNSTDVAIAQMGMNVFHIGGMKDGKILSHVYVYSMVRDRWESLPPLNVKRFNHRAITVGDSVLVLGGQNTTGHIDSYEEIRESGTWKQSLSLYSPVKDRILTYYQGHPMLVSIDKIKDGYHRSLDTYLYKNSIWERKLILNDSIKKHVCLFIETVWDKCGICNKRGDIMAIVKGEESVDNVCSICVLLITEGYPYTNDNISNTS